MNRTRRDSGNASVEFIAVCVALLLPIAYAIVAFAQLESAVYGINGAAQMAARAFVQGNSEYLARYAAARSAAIAGRNHGLFITTDDVVIACGSTNCLVPGMPVRVTVATRARIGVGPFARTIPLQARQDTVVDTYRQAPV